MTNKIREEFSHYDLKPYKEYTVSELTEFFTGILKEAEEQGCTDCRLSFQSNMEPYEDFLGDPSVFAIGYRNKTKEELKKEEEDERIYQLSLKLGTSLYETKVLLKHKDKLKGLEDD